jgi:hypothetical protein
MKCVPTASGRRMAVSSRARAWSFCRGRTAFKSAVLIRELCSYRSVFEHRADSDEESILELLVIG